MVPKAQLCMHALQDGSRTAVSTPRFKALNNNSDRWSLLKLYLAYIPLLVQQMFIVICWLPGPKE